MGCFRNRREFLTLGIGLTTLVEAGGCSKPNAATETESEQRPTGTSEDSGGVKLSLSVRVAEKFSNKRESAMTINQLIDLAENNGYEAICMRASQAGVHTPPGTVQQINHQIHTAGLVVSMTTGDFAVPQNDEHGPDGLRNITPYLDLADAFQCDLMRVCMKKEEDIEWAQRAADEAQERNIRLAHQAHCASMFETVEGAFEVFKRVNRSNFGLIYEPANWMIVGEPYGRQAIEKLRNSIFNVYVQNHLLDPGADAAVNTWKRGRVHLRHIGIWEEGGVDFEEIFAALRDIEYVGYLTVHQAFEGVMSVEDAVRKSADYLSRLIG